ncbi:MAG: hypothetical protein RL742_1381, partial [Bacteroidota bacterium]
NKPVGMSARSSGARVIGVSNCARKSIPALPGVS